MEKLTFKFEQGKPACPVACKYCHVTELDTDWSAAWSQGLVGLNKACTFMNVPPWIAEDQATQQRFFNFPWHLLQGDFAGWTAVTDGFMPSLLPYFWHWIEQVSPQAKLVTVVTKWAINREFMQQLALIPNLFLVITITGNEPPIEKIGSSVHLRTLDLAMQHGVRCLPMVHPYISGVSNLNFLPTIKKLGYSEISVKGLRYNPETMASWMPQTSKSLYEIAPFQEILLEDGWRQLILDSGLKLLSPKEWYWRDGLGLDPKLTKEKATELVSDLLAISQIASSATKNEVINTAIARRL